MPATREDLFARLDGLGIETTTVEHPQVFTVAESQHLRGLIPGGHSKNLFLKDAKGALWLLTCREEAKIDLKALPARIGSAKLSFGKPDLMLEVLGIEPGSVTPFAVINDVGHRVNVVLDEAMLAHEVMNFHPLVNSATTSIRSRDLMAFIRACGHAPRIVRLD